MFDTDVEVTIEDGRTYTLEDMRDWFLQTRGFPTILTFGLGDNQISGEGQSGGRYVTDFVKEIESKFVNKLGIDKYRNLMDELMEPHNRQTEDLKIRNNGHLQESIDRILFISNFDIKNPPKINEGYIDEINYGDVMKENDRGYPQSYEYEDEYRMDEAVPPKPDEKEKLPSQGGPMPQADAAAPEGGEPGVEELPDLGGEELPDLGGEAGGEELPDLGDEAGVEELPDLGDEAGVEPDAEPETPEVPELTKTDLDSVEKEVESVEDYSKKVLTQQASIMATIQDLSDKLGNVEQLSQQVQKIGQDIEEIKPPSYQEQLEMQSTQSYPFNVKLSDYWDIPDQDETNQTPENLTIDQDDIENYDEKEIKDSLFTTGEEEEELERY
jgi:hypothetical protein